MTMPMPPGQPYGGAPQGPPHGQGPAWGPPHGPGPSQGPPHGPGPAWGPPARSGYPPPGAGPTRPALDRAPSRWPVLLPAGVVSVVAGAVVGWMFLGGVGAPDVLDAEAVAAGALKIVREDFGIPDASDMVCPPDQPATTDSTFVCTFAQGSHASSVQIVVTNDSGDYVVGAAP